MAVRLQEKSYPSLAPVTKLRLSRNMARFRERRARPVVCPCATHRYGVRGPRQTRVPRRTPRVRLHGYIFEWVGYVPFPSRSVASPPAPPSPVSLSLSEGVLSSSGRSRSAALSSIHSSRGAASPRCSFLAVSPSPSPLSLSRACSLSLAALAQLPCPQAKQFGCCLPAGGARSYWTSFHTRARSPS